MKYVNLHSLIFISHKIIYKLDSEKISCLTYIFYKIYMFYFIRKSKIMCVNVYIHPWDVREREKVANRPHMGGCWWVGPIHKLAQYI